MADPDVEKEQDKDGDEDSDDPVHSTCSFLSQNRPSGKDNIKT